jgi:3-oxoadipate enol-lactonase
MGVNMPKIQCWNKNIYYEIHGEGEPLLIVNGIMMSTASWLPFINVLSAKYKLVLFDLVDQGQSDKMAGEPFYTQDYHVQIIKELIEKLNLGKIHLFGISYGGEIAIKFALAHEDMIHSLILSNVPFKTTGMLRYIANRWRAVFKTYDGIAFFQEVNQLIYAEKFYDDNAAWLEERAQFFKQALPKEWYDGMIRLLDSGDDYNPENDLSRINTRTLIIGGNEDRITPIKYQKQIADKIKNANLIIVDGAAHVLPYEKPYVFCMAILGFLEVCRKEIKTM